MKVGIMKVGDTTRNITVIFTGDPLEAYRDIRERDDLTQADLEAAVARFEVGYFVDELPAERGMIDITTFLE